MTERFSYVPNHPYLAVEELPSPWRDAETVNEFLRSLAEGVQQIEDDAFDLLVSSGLSDASGDVLDQWGDLVGEPRGGFDDQTYRRFIRGRIEVSLTEGTADELIDLYQTLTAAPIVRHWELHPAAAHITCYRQSTIPADIRERIRELMELAAPAGVELVLTESTFRNLESDDDATLQPGGMSRLI